MKKRKLPEVHINITKSLVCSDDTKRKLKHKWVRLPSSDPNGHTYVQVKDEHSHS